MRYAGRPLTVVRRTHPVSAAMASWTLHQSQGSSESYLHSITLTQHLSLMHAIQ